MLSSLRRMQLAILPVAFFLLSSSIPVRAQMGCDVSDVLDRHSLEERAQGPVPDDAYWSDVFDRSGLEGPVNAIFSDSGRLYIAGAMWDGSWHSLSRGYISAITVFKGQVCVGSYYHRLQILSGGEWMDIGGELDGPSNPMAGLFPQVNALAADDDHLYMGGLYIEGIGDVVVSNVAMWNGVEWSDMNGGVDGSVNSIAVSDGYAYVAGAFSTAGGVPARTIARWDGSAWTALDDGVDGQVWAVHVAGDGRVYAGGDFRSASGVPAGHIGVWDGDGWQGLPGGVSGRRVSAIESVGRDVYFGGDFTAAGGAPAGYIAKWDGTRWSYLDGGMDWRVYALEAVGEEIVAGGLFTVAGQIPTYHVARWDGVQWLPVGGTPHHGMADEVLSVDAAGGELYATGRFAYAGDEHVHQVARWDGSSWAPLGGGISGVGVAVEADGEYVFVGGEFSRAYNEGSSIVANNIARWDGDVWTTLGGGADDVVYALAARRGKVYVGGKFKTVSGMPAAHIAAWNGREWETLGSGVDGEWWSTGVYAIEPVGDALYVGGCFETAGGQYAAGIARWTGSEWESLGGGLGDGDYPFLARVYALGSIGSNLYVAGDFGRAGDQIASHIAMWDGDTWTAMDHGVDAPVRAVAISGERVYIGGSFESVGSGGASMSRIAAWGGGSWTPVGSGAASGRVMSLTSDGTSIFAGGSFTGAGGKRSYYIGQWKQPDPMVVTAAVTVVPNTVNRRARGKWINARIELPAPYDVEDIDIRSARLNGTVAADLDHSRVSGAGDGRWLTVAFPRQASAGLLTKESGAAITVTGVVKGTLFSGSAHVTMVDGPVTTNDETHAHRPGDVALRQNVPNPFNPTTTITFELPAPVHALLQIYDVNGRLVQTLVDRPMEPGAHRAVWRGRDASGNTVSTGFYFYRLTAGEKVRTRKMLLLK